MQLYEPLHTLKTVADDIWIVDGPVVRMRLPLVSIPFPTRMVVVRLPDQTLWVWSPTELVPSIREHLEALGKVAHLVSPNRLHYAHIPAWQAAYPQARAWASPGVEARARSQGIAAQFDEELGDEAPAAWNGVIDQLVFRGSRIVDEVVFFHRPSQTLIVADLVENFEKEKIDSPFFRWLSRMGRAQHPDGQTPLDLRWSFLGRQALARAHAEKILAWAPERLVMAHGRWFANNATPEVVRALRWVGWSPPAPAEG